MKLARPHLPPALLVSATLLLAGCLPAVTWLPDGKRIAYVQGGAVWLTDLAGQRTKLYAATGETPWFVTAAPAEGGAPRAVPARLAVVAVSAAWTRLTFLDDTGRIEWSLTFSAHSFAAAAETEDGPSIALATHPWDPQGARLLLLTGQAAAIVDCTTRGLQPVAEPVADARFSPAGDLWLLTGTLTGRLGLIRQDRGGHRAPPVRWRVPADMPDDGKPQLNADASAVWLARSSGSAHEILADRLGKVLFSSIRGKEADGPDDQSFITKDAGWALIRVGGPVLNLNPAYNRLVQTEVNWQMEGVGEAGAAAVKPEPEFTSLPAWSPDRTRFAVMTKSLLVVVDVATNAVTPLAKW